MFLIRIYSGCCHEFITNLSKKLCGISLHAFSRFIILLFNKLLIASNIGKGMLETTEITEILKIEKQDFRP